MGHDLTHYKYRYNIGVITLFYSNLVERTGTSHVETFQFKYSEFGSRNLRLGGFEPKFSMRFIACPGKYCNRILIVPEVSLH